MTPAWAQHDPKNIPTLFVYENNGKDFSKVPPAVLEKEVYQRASVETKQALKDSFGFIQTIDPNNRRE